METHDDPNLSSDPLTTLPFELLERILSRPDALDHRDLSSLALVSRRMNLFLSDNNNIWRQQFLQTYPRLMLRTPPHHQEDDDVDFRSAFRDRYRCEGLCRKELVQLSRRYFHRPEMSDANFNGLVSLIPEFGSDVVLDCLRDVIESGDQDTDLTGRFYGRQGFRFLDRRRIAAAWTACLARVPADHFRMYEEGCALISQWYQPFEYVDADVVSKKLDDISEAVRKRLPVKSLEAPCKGKALMERLDALNQVLYGDLGFKGNVDDYYVRENSFVDKVLVSGKGIPISMCLVYLAVAGRVGVRLQPVNFPTHFLLSCFDAEKEEDFYVDAFSEGRKMDRTAAAEAFNPTLVVESSFQPAKPLEVFLRMSRNLCSIEHNQQSAGAENVGSGLRTAYELMNVLEREGRQFNTALALCEIYLELNVNHAKVMEDLQMLKDSLSVDHDDSRVVETIQYCKKMCQRQQALLDSDKDKEPKLRQPEASATSQKKVNFGVGMVMKHLKYNYNCVIFGWDKMCAASQLWVQQMGVKKLPLQDKQPFYNVMVDDGSVRYAAQENLIPVGEAEEQLRISHPLVGKYFQEFKGRYYEMNPELRRCYPTEQMCELLEMLKQAGKTTVEN